MALENNEQEPSDKQSETLQKRSDFLSPPIKPKSKFKKILFALVILAILRIVARQILQTPHKKFLPEEAVTEVIETYCLRKNELLPDAFIRCAVPQPLVKRALQALSSIQFDYKRLKPSDTIRIVAESYPNDTLANRQKRIKKIEYQMGYHRVYEINFDSTKTTVSMAYKEFSVQTCLVQGKISSSLYESLIKIGERPDLAFNFADIFGWEIDFFVETQEGDSFFILVDKKYADSVMVDYGRIKLARYKGKIGDYYGVFFEDPEGHKDYYDLEGKSLRKAFLRSPLRYSRISSYFSKARFHPILRIVRPHHGVDYVAPQGTPVSVIGDGQVTFAGFRGGYGRLVEVRHRNGFVSRYGHLSGLAKGIRTGVRVAQGQRIGYVGATGLATGPHLHFELLKDGNWVNPLRIIPPRAEPVKKEYFANFKETCDQLLTTFSGLAN
uniref:M23 family metallopeptidase n=1 Tax=candidate division WOR-3 bacterium TaxID=2052148 RepID=A0A7C6A857_UNCW3